MKIITYILILFPIIAFAGDYPDCNIMKETQIFFSNDKVKDILSINIKGQPCYDAELLIQIKDINGKILYKYSSRFKPHIAIQWDDPELDKDAMKFTEQSMKESNFKSTKALPSWMPEEDYYEEYYQEIMVSKSYYDNLRQKNWITFTHMNHYEGWQVVVFDREQNKVVIVSKGGL